MKYPLLARPAFLLFCGLLGSSLTLRRARAHVIEEIHKLEGAEHCPVQFED